MKFEFTPDEVQTIATELVRRFKKDKFKVLVEKPIYKEAPYCTTLIAEKAGLKKIIECQKSVDYRTLVQLVRELACKRLYAEVYIATDEESTMTAGITAELTRDGVGLMIVGTGSLTITINPKNFALIINIDPTLKLGEHKSQVNKIVDDFNNIDRKAALREMCEMVEGETARLIIKAVKKKIITGIDVTNLDNIDWSNQINILASKDKFTNKKPFFDENLKNDFHSFRGARNLIDHKVKNKKEDLDRQKQYVERMHQGPRLLSILLSLRRKI